MIIKTLSYLIGFYFMCQAICGYAWNAVGHRLVAQIAYDNLTPQAKRLFNDANHGFHQAHRHYSLVDASVWMDELHDTKFKALKPMHYIDIPYVIDDTAPPKVPHVNAVYAIDMARNILLNPASKSLDRTIAVRILWHVIGDIHQPLHAITRVNQNYPKGDKGGNFYYLSRNAVGNNLHQYWDRGGGLLLNKKQDGRLNIKKMARSIERQWLCVPAAMDTHPSHWAKESHQIAINHAYRFSFPHYPDIIYQQRVRNISKKQIALAGCRLAALSNQLAS